MKRRIDIRVGRASKRVSHVMSGRGNESAKSVKTSRRTVKRDGGYIVDCCSGVRCFLEYDHQVVSLVRRIHAAVVRLLVPEHYEFWLDHALMMPLKRMSVLVLRSSYW